jgi:hypothetical protein
LAHSSRYRLAQVNTTQRSKRIRAVFAASFAALRSACPTPAAKLCAVRLFFAFKGHSPVRFKAAFSFAHAQALQSGHGASRKLADA